MWELTPLAVLVNPIGIVVFRTGSLLSAKEQNSLRKRGGGKVGKAAIQELLKVEGALSRQYECPGCLAGLWTCPKLAQAHPRRGSSLREWSHSYLYFCFALSHIWNHLGDFSCKSMPQGLSWLIIPIYICCIWQLTGVSLLAEYKAVCFLT